MDTSEVFVYPYDDELQSLVVEEYEEYEEVEVSKNGQSDNTSVYFIELRIGVNAKTFLFIFL